MKKIISFFINFPVAVNVVILAFFVFGIMGALSMKSSFFPLVESRMITINLTYPGASPIEMEEGLVLKIEDNLKGLVGIERVTSVSRENSASILVEVEKGKNIDVILAEVKNAVDRVPNFPSGMEPAVVSKVENMRGTIDFTVSGDNISLATLKEYARQIENDLRGIDGISQVELSGFPAEEIEIAVRENDLRAFNLTFEQVANAVRQTNLLITGGSVKTKNEEFLIRALNRNYYADELQKLIIKADNNGHVIRLYEVANVSDKWSETPDRIYFNAKPAINISVSNTNTEDLLSSAEKVRTYIKDFNATHDNIRLDITADRSVPLNQRTKLLMKNAAMGIFLVLIFLALFLETRLAFWVAFGIPISFLGMFMFVAQLGVTINVLSLFGMIIVIGILVDDGIVVGENIYHHYEMGKSKIRAAIDGTLEVASPVISAVITTVLAFGVFYFVDGRMGDNFKEVSTIVILTLSVSLFEALIVLPAHIAHSKALEKEGKKPKDNAIMKFLHAINAKADKGLKKVRDNYYIPYLAFFLKHRLLGFVIPLALFIISMGALRAGIVKSTFFPNIESDRVSINLRMPQGTNERITDSIISVIEEKVWIVNQRYTDEKITKKSMIENVIKRIGPGTSQASLTVNLLPGDKRALSSPVINADIRKEVGKIPGVESLTFGSGGHFGGSPIAVSLLGNNIEELKAAKEFVKDRMAENSNLKDISDNDPAGIKEIRITLKDKAHAVGMTLQQVMNQVRYGFFGYQAQRFQRGQDEIKVWVRYTRDNRSTLQHLDDMQLVTPSGERVAFRELADYSIERGDIAINHLNGKREIQVTSDLSNPEDSATELLEEIKSTIIPEMRSRFSSVTPLYEGQNREAEKTMNSLPKAGLTALALIYIIIAFTFRSYTQPLMLIFMIPFSFIGVVWGHYIHGFPVNVLSVMGIVALIGIMVNDGLVLIEKFNGNLRKGQAFDEAMINTGRSRFRPILLTSVTTIAGLMPLLLEKSRQAQFLQPMAISISYGIMIATFLTLLMLPVLLSSWNSFRVFMRWLFTGEKVTREEIEQAIIEQKAEAERLED